MSLRKKAVQGIKWAIITTIIIRVTTFATKIFLARILLPADFGLVSISILVIDSIGLFREMGLSEALIYKKNDDNHTAANSMFFILPIIATVLFLIVYMTAPFAALFFDNQSVEPVVRILSFTLVLQSFGSVQSTLLQKELEFKKKMLSDALPKIGYAIITISLASLGYGVWSLVYGQILSTIIMVVLLWIVSDWVPTLKFDKKVALELFDYGKHVFASGILVFVISNIDYLVVGKMIGVEALGLYTIAFNISNLPASQITSLTGTVTFPMYSKLQDNLSELKRVYISILKYVSILSFPLALGIFAVSKDFIGLILGDKWLPAVPPLQIMCLLGLIDSIAATCVPVLKATGNPKIFKNVLFVRLGLIAIIVIPLTFTYGIFGTALAITIPALVTALIQIYKTKKILNQSIFSLLHVLILPFINSVIMMFLVLYLRSNLHIISFLQLISLILSGIVVYIFLTLLTDKEIREIIAKLEIKEILKNSAL
jgi:O-antigen/teichoic acid export membrane protein